MNAEAAFDALTELLASHRALWSESAFTSNELSWSERSPRLYGDLLALSDAELGTLEQEGSLLLWLSSYVPALRDLPALTPTPTLERERSTAVLQRERWAAPGSVAFGVPQRKREQIEGFVQALLGWGLPQAGERPVVDWCSGRGYLAQAVHSVSGARVLCLERDASLHRPDLSPQLTFLGWDVRETLDSEVVRHASLHTALHACGDLHLSMLRQTALAGAPALACSPCCYHATREAVDNGLSQRAQATNLRPTREELRLATAELATANARQRALRQRELLWRLAFDQLLRQLRKVDAYSRTPSIRKSLLTTDFRTFAQHLVQELERKGRKDFDFPSLSPQAEAELMRQAHARLAVVRRLEKAQLAFRPALERWLLLDRALFLQECGYRVAIREFCSKQDSARNHLLLAEKRV